MSRSTAVKLSLACLAVLLLLMVFDGLAGAFVFVFAHQDPRGARWMTLYDAWNSTRGHLLGERRVRGAVLSSALLTVGLAGALITLGASLKRAKPLHGDARFALPAEVRKAGLFGKKGLILGRLNGQLLRLPGAEFVLVSAPTRSGKGVSFVIPNLLDWPDSAVVLDIKGENYNLTSAFRKQCLGNEVFLFNPFSERSHACNFLSYVSADPVHRVTDLLGIAAIVYPTERKNPFWSELARNLFVGIGLLVLETPQLPQTIGEMLRQASGKGRALERYLQDVIAMREESGEPFSVACVAALNRFLQSPEETSRNVLASFVAPLSLFGNPVVDKATSSDDFDLRDLRKRKMSVYVNIPAAEVAQAGFMLNVFFSVLINQNIKELPEDTPELRYVCLLMLDEFTAAGRIAPIAKGVGFMAGYNLRLAIVVQDKSQLEQEEAYGKAGAQSILANMGAVVSFAPRTEAESESLSKLIGFETVTVRQRQRSWGRGPRTHSENEVQHRRAVMLPQELRSMNSGKALVQRPGVAVILADNITYYDDQRFSALLSQVPHRIVNVAGTNRRVPVPTEAPPTGWEAYKIRLLDSDFYVKGQPASEFWPQNG